jgi:hypothetical protein
MRQSTPSEVGPRKRRSVQIAIIANTAIGPVGKRDNCIMYIDVRLDLGLGRSITRPSKSRQRQSGRVG